MNLQPLSFVIGDGGALTLDSVIVLNMLPSPDEYPLGLLSCLLWFVSVNRCDVLMCSACTSDV